MLGLPKAPKRRLEISRGIALQKIILLQGAIAIMKKNKPKPERPPAPTVTPLMLEALLSKTPLSSFSFKALCREFGISTKAEKIELAVLLQKMVAGGDITLLPDGNVQSNQGMREMLGRLDFVNPRFGYLVSDTVTGGVPDRDIYIQADRMHTALDGDRIKVRLFTSKRNGRLEGEVIEVIERRRTRFVGRIELGKRYAFVVPDNKRMHIDIFVNGEDLKEAKHGDKVIVEITEWGSDERNPVGTVIDVLGPAGENDTEMHAIMAEFGLPYEFPESVEAEAEAISTAIPEEEIKQRRDFRKVPTFTIDPADAKDFDDALSFQRLDNGHIEVGVHIADVTYYVRPGTALEKEAVRRATSVYLVDRCVPMLPEKLSNELCSLRPHEDKLTFSAVFELDEKGKIHNSWYGRTVIHSQHRFAYEDAQRIIEGEDGPMKEEVLTLNAIAHHLREARFKAGAIAFETPEVKFKLDEKGAPLAVVPRVRKDAHKLIEDYMLLANKGVAEYVYGLKKGKQKNTMVYRIHEAPDPDRLKVFSAFAKKFGYSLDPEGPQVSKEFNAMIEALHDRPEQDVLQNLAVRTMQKARYSTEATGHFGLGYAHYSHFTSPIRRYPDMMAHRLLQHYLDGGESMDSVQLEEGCKHSSYMERLAAEAERASIKYKQVEYMILQEPNRLFEGIISGVTEWGFYVEIVETKCEGLVRITDLLDDYYEHDAENYRLIGTRSKRIFAFGDRVEVRIKQCNLEKRTIDLALIDDDLARFSHLARQKSVPSGKGGRGYYKGKGR